MQNKRTIIKNGRIIDPATATDRVADILIENGVIREIGSALSGEAEIIEARNAIVCPGLFDMHVHLREPGREDEETIASGCRAALAGGFTGLACMPNTNPPIDNQEVIKFIIKKAEGLPVRVYPIATITKGRKGTELTEIGDAAEAGAVAVSDDGDWIGDGNLMRRALEYARMFNIPVISHCEDKSFMASGCMNEGLVSTILGLRGIPRLAEETAVARDIAIAAFTKSRLHIAHVSTAEAVALVRLAKQRGLNVTAETAPHYISLDEEQVRTYNTNFKMNPPLRTQRDIQAIRDGLKDGTIDAIATDHAPHASEEKDVEFDVAPFGIIGLETAFSVCWQELVANKVLTPAQLIERMSLAPARILNIKKSGICVGSRADLTVFDPSATWTVQPEKLHSISKNTPYLGQTLTGKVIAVVS